jgi:excisionase family DNA binding protein
MTQLHKLSELSKQLSVSRSTLERDIERGNLLALKVGGGVRVPSDEVERYISTLIDAKTAKEEAKYAKEKARAV